MYAESLASRQCLMQHSTKSSGRPLVKSVGESLYMMASTSMADNEQR